jgi:hypothetical protein
MDTQSAFKFLTFLGIFCMVHFSTLAKAPLRMALPSFCRSARLNSFFTSAVEWVAQFPSDPEKYDLEKADTRSTFQSMDDTAEELLVSLPLRRPTSVAIQAGENTLAYALSYTPGDDGAFSSREANAAANATRFGASGTLSPKQPYLPLLSISRQGSLLSRTGSTRKGAPAQIVIREPAKRVAIAVDDSPTADPSEKNRSSKDSSRGESSRSSAETSVSDMLRSAGTFVEGGDQTGLAVKAPGGGLVSRWSSSTRTTDSSGVATPAPVTMKQARISNWSEAVPPGRPPGA